MFLFKVHREELLERKTSSHKGQERSQISTSATCCYHIIVFET